MRKWVYATLVTGLMALNTALFFWRRSGGRAVLGRSSAVTPTSAPEAVAEAAQPTPAAPPPAPIVPPPPAARPLAVTRPSRLSTLSLDAKLFALALVVFLLTRFIGLDRWPIYFFTDEAIQTVQAANLLNHGWRDATGTLLPTYFQNGTYFNLSVSVYAQVIPYALFGFSVVVTRGVSVLVALCGAAAVGLILRDIFKVKFWWVGTLILSVTPAFFLHSRTAFETIFGTSLYAWFLYFYLRYRHGTPRRLYPALVCGALAFYAYSPQQAIVVFTGLGLLISDARYHWQQRKTALVGLVLLIVLVLPYARFQSEHPDEAWLHLRILDSYVLNPTLTTPQKLEQFGQTYLSGLSPAYWYGPQIEPDLIRHVMLGYGRLLSLSLPFLLLGLGLSVWRIKSPASRAVLIALLVTPIGGALAQIQVYRLLSFTVPAALLTALGLIAVLNGLTRRVPYRGVALGVWLVLSAINGYLLVDALNNGPTWFDDYHMGGLQYGGQQVFQAAQRVVQRDPQARVLVSPTWANGTDVLAQFFVPQEPRISMGNIDAFMFSKLDLPENLVLVMTPQEYQRALADPKFTRIQVEQTLPYPNGADGFYFVRLAYSPQADALFAAEDAARREPVKEDIIIGGQTVSVVHSQFDVGQLPNLFDGDTFTLVRTLVDNPVRLNFTFAEPRPLSGVTVSTGTMDFTLTLTATLSDGTAHTFSRDFLQTGPDPTNDLPFDPPLTAPVAQLTMAIKDLNPASDGHIHVREVTLR